MIDNYLLEELVTFASEKTLAKTAEKLNVTQPTVTRGMQKLEDELGIQLFERHPNRIILTDTGKLAAEKATEVLAVNRNFVQQLQNYAARQSVIKIAAIAPGPLILFRTKQASFSTHISINDDFTPSDQVTASLLNNENSIIISDQEIQTDQIESRYLGTENLYVNLDKFMYLANSHQVSFRDLAGLSFVVLNDIGPWKEIIQKYIPNAKFLYQEEWAALTEITKYSSFPYFSTNITTVTPRQRTSNDDRVRIPITDEAATMTFYANYLKKQRKSLTPLLNEISQNWPNLS
ncbi:LysR family transcriptional regulator [Limosilactobacillus reuteri]|uniref:LysR family transcriptional regulator n=1 Tax=Limosilactobacillus reuteri TaxID=1598 RepID=UPI001E460DD4|nr:LysR family transcriptional regulator [Limosilactobacillus reuteri]MCC4325493.1 LysR family transcriptional regulator [Limosilactobacillus reuteri]MCC4329212.1 LysR family transcriptional regulator [Limosilactobacillus reuteri]MCC4352699.1 LysR family transcriptional regulator [Limosilactobacillus reuteri]MCC4377475.1 LysR family transcriptional regulator [Limosilactobacillus reuteri]